MHGQACLRTPLQPSAHPGCSRAQAANLRHHLPFTLAPPPPLPQGQKAADLELASGKHTLTLQFANALREPAAGAAGGGGRRPASVCCVVGSLRLAVAAGGTQQGMAGAPPPFLTHPPTHRPCTLHHAPFTMHPQTRATAPASARR